MNTENDKPYIIWDSPVDREDLQKLQDLQISSSNEILDYKSLIHYCSLETLEYIFSLKTLRCTALNGTTLNDQFEAKLNKVERFSGSRFITCFSNCQYEIVPFWYNYGGSAKTRKVALKFENNFGDLKSVFFTDYCFTPNRNKCFFYSDEYKRTINTNGIMRKLLNIEPINTDYDLYTCIKQMSIFNITYLPRNNDVFTQEYSKEVDIKLSDGTPLLTTTAFNPTNLGKHKTEHWTYEQETRLMCMMDDPNFTKYSYIDLRLKDNIFKNLEIILTPWAKKTLKDKIEKIIENSSLYDGIKQTIRISDSELYHQII